MRQRFGRRRRQPPAWQRGIGLAMAVVQLALLGAALRDLRRRPAEKVRGPKIAWLFVSFVNIIGPVAYLTVGRRREAPDPGWGEDA